MKDVTERESKSKLKSPFELYIDDHLNEVKSITTQKEEWNMLSEPEKLQYIKCSVKLTWQSMQTDKQLMKRKKVPRLMVVKHKKLTKLEEDIYGQYLAKKAGTIPTDIPYLFYFESGSKNENSFNSFDETLAFAEKAFSKLSEDDQYEWYKKQIQAFVDYVKLEGNWKKALNSFDLHMYETWSQKQLEMNKIPQQKIMKKKLANVVEKAVPVIPFKFEIPFPPSTPSQLFARIYSGDDDELAKTKIGSRYYRYYRGLDPLVKDVCQKIVSYIRRKFTKETLDYVDSLSEENKVLFVGLKRRAFYWRFGEDIFETRYPLESYPVINNTLNLGKGGIQLHKRKRVEETETIPDNFSCYAAIRDSILRLQQLVDYNLDSSDSDTDN